MSIRLSPTHGVNPALSICFWCGKEKNELLLLGLMRGDAEAPRHILASYEPCDSCAANMARGITIIEATTHQVGELPPIQEGMWATGMWAVITEDAARRLFQPQDVVDSVLRHRKAFMDSETWDRLKMPRTNTGETV